MEKTWLYEILLFEVGIIMVKDKEKYNIKDALWIKITSLMHYIKVFLKKKT